VEQLAHWQLQEQFVQDDVRLSSSHHPKMGEFLGFRCFFLSRRTFYGSF
jgi:hypothetical protein